MTLWPIDMSECWSESSKDTGLMMLLSDATQGFSQRRRSQTKKVENIEKFDEMETKDATQKVSGMKKLTSLIS